MVCFYIVGIGLFGKDYGMVVERYDVVKWCMISCFVLGVEYELMIKCCVWGLDDYILCGYLFLNIFIEK